MGFMDKLMFWKKHDDFGDLGNDFGSGKDSFANDPGLGSDPGLSNTGLPPTELGQDNFGGMQPPNGDSSNPSFDQSPGYNRKMSMPPLEPADTPNYGQAAAPAPINTGMEKEIELISVKLDSIRNTLEILNQRISRIERIAEAEQQQTPSRWV